MRDEAEAGLALDVLGPVRARWQHADLRLGPSQQQAMLAVLSGSPGRVVGREALIDALWGDDVPGYAVNLVQKYVSGLRRAFQAVPGGRDLIRWTGAGYQLDLPAGAVDRVRAETMIATARREADARPDTALAGLEQALELWRGEPFEGLNAPRLAAERERLAEVRLSAVEVRLGLLTRVGRPGEAVTELTGLVRDHPFRESLWEKLILAQYRAGRTGDALASYQRLRGVLAEELGSDPGERLRRLHQAVLSGDPSLTPPPVEPSTAHVTPRPVPAQLPPRLRAFVARETERSTLDRLLTDPDEDLRIAVVTGPAGTGKTALAVHWAHEVRPQFPDGQLYVNLRGFDPSGRAVDPTEAVRQFVDALGTRPESLPTTPEALGALYRSLLADRRMLIVLDNARDAEQVQPLLPGSGRSVVVVTSRNRLTGLVLEHGAEGCALDLLTPPESRRLLVARLGRARVSAEPDAAARIVERCGRLPLALAVVAARAAAHPDFGLADIAAELSQTRSHLDSFTAEDASVDLRAVFSWSYAGLSEGAAGLFRLLGPGGVPEVSVVAAAGVAGLPPVVARGRLAELARLHLVVERSPGRFGMHDLVRAYATELCDQLDPAQARSGARTRLFAHYLHNGDQAAAHLVAGRRETLPLAAPPEGIVVTDPGDPASAQEWFRLEQPAVQACLAQALEIGDDATAWRLAATLSVHLENRADWPLLEEVLAVSLSAAGRDGDVTGEGLLHRLLGKALIRLKRYREARTELELAVACADRQHDLAGAGRLHRMLAWTLHQEARGAEAIEHARLGVEIATRLQDPIGRGRAQNSLGWFYALDGRLAEGRQVCLEALAGQRANGDRFGAAETLDSLGLILFRLGEPAQGEAHYREACELFENLGDEFNAADSLVNLGDALLEADRGGAAVPVWHEALARLQRLGNSQAREVQDRLAGLGVNQPRPLDAVP